MRPTVLLCVSQQPHETPYVFKITGIHVYTFEEALYHMYHHWRQSVDDCCSDELITWVNDVLGLSFLAARMKELAKADSFSRRLLSLLRLIEYFDDAEIERLRIELQSWEKRRDWEKLKERADYLMNRDEPDKALTLYRRALQYEENTELLNNAGVALMRLEAYEDAYRYLNRALAQEPENPVLLLHYVEAAIYGHRYDDAQAALEKAEALSPGHTDIPFFHGLICYEQHNYPQSIVYFQEAIAQQHTQIPFYVYKLADVYVNMRQFDKALETLEQITDKNVAFYVKQAEVYASASHIPASIKSIRRALVLQNNDANLWTRLAMYHRLDYDLNAANGAIMRALSLDPDNERAKLENARIKKGMGRTKDYQAVLNSVLQDFKQKYRELC